MLALLVLLACTDPAPTPIPGGSAIDGKPSVVEDGGPTLSEEVAADAAIPADPLEAPEQMPMVDAAAAAAVNAEGAPRADTEEARQARANFNPISVPQDGDGVQDWEWPTALRGRGVDIDGDGEFEGSSAKKRVKFSTLVDDQDLHEELKRDELKGRRKKGGMPMGGG